MTPIQLTIAAQKGDAEAFAALMELHQSQLYRIAYAYLHDEGDALEAIQKSTFRAFHKLKKLKEPSSLALGSSAFCSTTVQTSQTQKSVQSRHRDS